MDHHSRDQPYARDELEATQFQFLEKAFCALFCAALSTFLWTRWGPASLLTTFMFLSVSAVLFWIGYHSEVMMVDRPPKQRRLYMHAYACFCWIGLTPFVLEKLGTLAFTSSIALLAAATAVFLWFAHRSVRA